MSFSGYPIYYPVSGSIPTQISDDAGKIFVGGIPTDASKETLSDYFSQFGAVSNSIIMVDNVTGRSRGFGFVTFVDNSTVDKVIRHSKHTIMGKVVDAKRAVPKGPNQGNILRAMGITSNRADRNPDCKVFVGGVAQGTTESDLKAYFKDFGEVLEVKIPKDQSTQRARGFSFVLFDNSESVVNATKDSFHRINGKMVEVKKIQLQNNKNQFGSDDGQLRGSQQPFVMSSRPMYPYVVGLMGNMNQHSQFYQESIYDPVHSEGAGSPASSSVSSSGYGNIQQSPSGQRIEDGNMMMHINAGLSELSLGSPYLSRNRAYPTLARPQYSVHPGDTLSTYNHPGPSPPVPLPSDFSYNASPLAMYVAQIGGQLPAIQTPQYVSTSNTAAHHISAAGRGTISVAPHAFNR